MALVTDLTARRLEHTLAQEQTTGRIPSVVAALTRDGSLVWRGSRGEATGEPGIPPADLQYRIGSITKTMTAVLVLQLRDAGRLALGDALGEHLPEVPHGEVTLRELLSHTSGLPAEPPGEWWERSGGVPFDQLVASLATADPPFMAALGRGVGFHYSNIAFALLGEVVSRLSGKPWWECVTERLLQPLGMLRTTYDPFPPHAQGYSVAPHAPLLTEEPATDTGAMAPAGQVWSTVMDLATYADFLLSGRRDVLALETLEEMSTPQSGSAAEGMAAGYGLGLRLLPGGSGTLVGHTGSMPGFQASLFVDRRRRTGAVVLANSTQGLRSDRLPARMMEVLEELEPHVDEPWTPVDSVPAEVQELLGVWYWGNTPRELTWDGAVLSLGTPGETSREDRFRLGADGFVGVAGYHQGEPLRVVRRDDGRVGHLVVSTFVLTRSPYDPAAPHPGGLPG